MAVPAPASTRNDAAAATANFSVRIGPPLSYRAARISLRGPLPVLGRRKSSLDLSGDYGKTATSTSSARAATALVNQQHPVRPPRPLLSHQPAPGRSREGSRPKPG